MKSIILILALFGFINVAQAQELQYYNVEVVIFSQKNPTLGSERWPAQALAIDEKGLLDISKASRIKRSSYVITRLKKSQKKLSGYARSISSSSNYQLLAHSAWRQPGLSEKNKLAIRIKALPLPEPVAEQKPRSWTFNTINQPSMNTPDNLALAPNQIMTSTASSTQKFTPPRYVRYTLDGSISLVRSRYLHVYTDLVYSPASNNLGDAIEVTGLNSDTADLPLQSFQLKTHRRMRSKELHYIDHPLLGILVLVTPVS